MLSALSMNKNYRSISTIVILGRLSVWNEFQFGVWRGRFISNPSRSRNVCSMHSEWWDTDELAIIIVEHTSPINVTMLTSTYDG